MHPRPLLHLEGAAVLTLSLFAYHWTDAGWLLFAELFLVPDLFMIGYLVNVRLAAILYNLVHTYVGPLALAGAAAGAHHPALLPFAFIWTAHIGMDRMLGYGLKFPTRFKDTHLNPDRLGLSISGAPTSSVFPASLPAPEA